MALSLTARIYARQLPPVVRPYIRDLRYCTTAPAMTDDDKIKMLRSGVAPATGQQLKDIAADIWDHNTNPVGPGNRSGLKILQRPLKGPLYNKWYMPPPWKDNPDYPIRMTEKQARWQEKLKLLRAAGKGPPKKGAGKRSK